MSQHEIEGLIEDNGHLVARLDMPVQDRRELFHALYSVQGRHDCGYTHFRCEDILRENQYLYSRPISTHADYGTSNFQDQLMTFKDVTNIWLTPPSGKFETVFAQREESTGGDIYFYFDCGTSLWQILIKEDETLAMNWYSYFTNILIQNDVHLTDGKDWNTNPFPDHLTQATLIEIRQMVEDSDMKAYKEDWDYLKAPNWREETKKSHHANPIYDILIPVIDAVEDGEPFHFPLHFPLVLHGYFHNDSSTPLL